MTSLIRKATKKEKWYYHTKLYPLQDDIFRRLSELGEKGFYLTGGTALSRFYYEHRYTDDLDIFFDGDSYDDSRFKVLCARLVDSIFNEHNVEIALEAEYFKRLFIRGEVDMKIELIFDPHRRVGSFQKFHGIAIDSKENITANKLSAIYGRTMTKDFFDLFFLLREIEFTDAIRFSEYKHVPLNYEGIMLAVGDILSSPSVLEGEILTDMKVDDTEFKNFIKDLIERLIIHAKSQ